jgi:dTDP-4-amino-4,6-dideoxygalactose transaminase
MSIAPNRKSDPKLAPWPFYAEDEIAAAAAVLRSGRVNYWTGGEGKAFEAEYAAHCHTQHALAVANGTLALELALHALDIGPGDDVIVPARTFIATAAVVALRGAKPLVADIDPRSQNLTPDTVAAVLTPRTKAVIPVHLAGWPVDMAALMAQSAVHGFKVIEDCAQAHGATQNDKPVGGLGHIGCFSFCQDKIVSTGGEGGMVVTNDTALYKKMWAYRDHGKDFDRTAAVDATPHFKWLVDSFGTNMRLTEVQSAIGRLQLRKLPQWTAQRRTNAAALRAALDGLNAVMVPRPAASLAHAYYKFYALIDPAALKSDWSRDRICTELKNLGVPAGTGACPDISKEAAFTKAGYGTQAPHPQADSIAGKTLMLPVHPTLTENNIAFMADTVRKVIMGALR